MVAVVLCVVPGDQMLGGVGRGPLLARLTAVEATAASRTETVVDRFLAIPADAVDGAHSLAADPDVGPLAQTFDELGVDTAAFTTDVFRYENSGGVLLRYRALAVGSGVQSSAPFMAVGFAQDDDASAREQAARFESVVRSGVNQSARRPWSELVTLVHLETRGRFVFAVLATPLRMLWLDLARHPDTLLWWHAG